MLKHCFVCHHEFPANSSLEHFGRARRVAFDIGRGRLWAVCSRCHHWSLVPLESRWEALDEVEHAGGRAQLIGQTDTISLLQVGEVELVRIGRAPLKEVAWWRHGRRLNRRRSIYRRITGVNSAAFAGVLVATAASGNILLIPTLGAWLAPGFFHHVQRERTFGITAWRGTAPCGSCGKLLRNLNYSERGNLILAASDEPSVSVRVPCSECRSSDPESGHQFPSASGRALLARALAYETYAGGPKGHVDLAINEIDKRGSPSALLAEVAGRRQRLSELSSVQRLALGVAFNEALERELIAADLAILEAHYGEAEEIASIADGELTAVQGFGDLVTKTHANQWAKGARDDDARSGRP